LATPASRELRFRSALHPCSLKSYAQPRSRVSFTHRNSVVHLLEHRTAGQNETKERARQEYVAPRAYGPSSHSDNRYASLNRVGRFTRRSCPICSECRAMPIILEHASAGGDCCGCIVGMERGDGLADLICNECAQRISTVPPEDIEQELARLAVTCGFSVYCGSRKIIWGREGPRRRNGGFSQPSHPECSLPAIRVCGCAEPLFTVPGRTRRQ
jgi:hypothetical protein